MITTSWRTGVESTMNYFDEHLSVGDYYMDENSKKAAVWVGEGATRLGLTGEVKREDFGKLTENINPLTDERLTARMNKTGQRRTWMDVTLSPPKDVSVLMAGAEKPIQEKLKNLHWQSSLKAAQEMEKLLGRRIRKNGMDANKIGGCEGVITAVLHDSARPVDGIPDPHLHSHLLFANAVYDKNSKEWVALQNQGLLEAQKYIRQFYYNEVVRGLGEMGIATETRERQNDFIVSGLSRELVESFSRRHGQVEKGVKEKLANGMFSAKDAAEFAVLEDRERKVKLSDADLTALWKERAGTKGRENIQDVLSGMGRANENYEHLSLADAIKFAKEHAFAQRSVVPKHEVLRIILQTSRGNATLSEIEKALVEDHSFLIAPDKSMTTREIIQEEKVLLGITNAGKGRHTGLREIGYITPKNFDSETGDSFPLSGEQMRTIDGVLDNKDFVMAINGVAGAGKTTLLKQIEKGSTLKLVPLAPSGQATGVLRDSGFKDSQTLQQWLVNANMRQITKNSLLVVDEAGMISTPQMRELLNLAKENGNRVLLVGDTKQIQSVERGDAFRLMQKFSKMETLIVEESHRQRKNKSYKEAVTLLRNASKKGEWNKCWDIFDNDLKCITEAQTPEPHLRDNEIQGKVCQKYLENPETLIVASKWETIHRINTAIRDELKKNNQLTGGQLRPVLEPVSLDQAQQRRSATYQKGDYLQLIRNTQGIGVKDELFRIERTEKGSIFLVSERSGKETSFKAKANGADFTLHKNRVIEIAQGDTLLIKKNLSADSPLKNGMRVKVASLNRDGSIDVTVPGKDNSIHTIPSNYNHFLHGYAVTAHASQGATVESVAVLGDDMRRELFYVAATRAKSEINIYTTDREKMEAQVKVSGQRASGIEIFSIKPGAAIEKHYVKNRFQHLHRKISDQSRRLGTYIKRTIGKEATRQNTIKKLESYHYACPNQISSPRR